ncbi:MAG: AMP-binding protein [Proteobacteria bacterium]|nr:AMP-binding protein [Pseudomonadota bacterium]MBU1688792.1 AMP-binding protein [Pseudomonadota bacterium]
MNPLYKIKQATSIRAASPVEIEALQSNLLRQHIQHAIKSPFYKNIFADIDYRPNDITLSNLADLPLTTRSDLDRNPEGFFAVPKKSWADIALTSGSTGNPVLVPYTVSDLTRLAFNEEMNFHGAGITPDDTMLLCVTIDRCFIAGLAYYTGLTRLGAATIRSGPGQPARQWELIRRLSPTGLVGVPSFLLKLAEWGVEHSLSPRSIGIRALITIGEPVRRPDHSLTPLGRELESLWGGQVISSYGATEFETAFCECSACMGGHIHPELMLVEIVDESGRNLPPGTAGEIVVTPLGVQGLPLIRFRTGDVARLHTAPCQCGWQTPRLGAVEGRLAQRLKYRGTTLYPEMIFQALQDQPEIRASYLEVRSSYDLSDEITVVIGVDNPGAMATAPIQEHLQSTLRVRPDILIRSYNEVLGVMEADGGRKLKRFIDLRGK